MKISMGWEYGCKYGTGMVAKMLNAVTMAQIAALKAFGWVYDYKVDAHYGSGYGWCKGEHYAVSMTCAVLVEAGK